jgi:hypothetical protein
MRSLVLAWAWTATLGVQAACDVSQVPNEQLGGSADSDAVMAVTRDAFQIVHARTGRAPHLDVTFVFDGRRECATAPENLEVAAAGLALWADFGVRVVEADTMPVATAARRDIVSVCFASGPFWGSRVGSTSWTERGVELTVRTDLPVRSWIGSVAAHELGHVILGSAEHLDDSSCGFIDAPDPCGGIMGGRYIWPDFTARDVEFAQARGLVWQGPEPAGTDL